MLKRFVVIVFAILFMTVPMTNSAEAAARIGVANIENLTRTVWNRSDFASAVYDVFTIELVNAGFDVVEREMIKSVLKEIGLNNTDGVFNPETMSRTGYLQGLNYLVFAKITDVSVINKTGFFIDKKEVRVGITARVVNVETGNIILAESAEGVTTIKYMSDSNGRTMGGSSEITEAHYRKAAQDAVAKLVQSLVAKHNKLQKEATAQ